MSLLQREAQYGLVWLSATAMLAAGLPRLGCTCLPGKCVASSGESAFSKADCCCPAKDPAAAEAGCCRTHHRQKTCCAPEPACFKPPVHEGNVAAPGCADCTGIPQGVILFTLVEEKEPDSLAAGQEATGGGNFSATDALAVRNHRDVLSCRQRILPPTDLITTLQRLLI